MKSFLCMRGKNLPMILFLILLLALSIPMVSVAKASPDGTVVYVEPPTDDPEIGDTFPVNVSIFNCSTMTDGLDADLDGLIDEDPYDGINNDGDGLTDEDGGIALWSFDFKLWFNTTILNATGVVPGPALDARDDYFSASFMTEIDNTLGMVRYSGTLTTLPPLPIPGNATLATINFTALEEGTSFLYLNETLVGKPAGVGVDHTTTDDSVTVIPEFPTILLVSLFLIATLATTFLGKKAWSRKRKDFLTAE